MADLNQMIDTPQGPKSLAYLLHCAAMHDDLVKSLKAATFIVESVAHLQGKERELLPTAEAARALTDHADAFNQRQTHLPL